MCTGFRSQEVATLTWDDVNSKAGTLAVQAKPELGFTSKNYEKRSVPVPRTLILSLNEHRKANPESALVFPIPLHPKRPNYGGEKPDAHALEACKEIAHRAGLNCGKCRSIVRKEKESQPQEGKTKVNRCISGPHCKKWYLHKWRHTFATNMLLSSLDIRSLQILLEHKNIATTEKYLKDLRLADLSEDLSDEDLSDEVGAGTHKTPAGFRASHHHFSNPPSATRRIGCASRSGLRPETPQKGRNTLCRDLNEQREPRQESRYASQTKRRTRC